MRRNSAWRRSARAAVWCQLKSAVCFRRGTMPSTRASSIRRSTATSLSRAATARNARPARISGPRRARQRRSYSLQPARAEAIVAQRVGEDAGREMAGQQPVVDAAAGRRLDEPGSIADGEDAIGPRPRHRAERQHAEARRRPRLARGRARRGSRRRTLWNRAPASRSQSRPTRANVVPSRSNGNDPRESSWRDLAPKCTSHLVERRKRRLRAGRCGRARSARRGRARG